MKIGIVYTKFYPLSSSASVHGFNLFQALKQEGVELHSIGIGSNSITVDHPKSIKGILQFIRSIDVVYIRINPWLWNDWFTLLKLFSFGRIKVIWELNAPVEEVLAAYKNTPPPKIRRWMRWQNFKRKCLASLCDGCISVSSVLENYSREVLKIINTVTIPNGSDPQLFCRKAPAPANPLTDIVKGKFVVSWAGNGAIGWQGTNLLAELAEYYAKADPDIFFLVFSNRSFYNQKYLPNLLSLGEINYDKLPELLQLSHVGFCLYNEYDWCKYGFYNSSLKMFDYLSLELIVIASDMGQLAEIIKDGENGFLVRNTLEELIEKINYSKAQYDQLEQLRKNARHLIVDEYNWQQVGRKTKEFIQLACR
ncbi:MAG: glycosyltransferase [Flavipsychrobacter sp.]|nr:glycosyltransferase [Flavipsychrobacter sp.]